MKKTLNKTCYRFFSCLANPTKLATIEILLEKPKSINEIADKLEEEQSMILHNLKPLLECNFIENKKEEKKIVYSLNYETIQALLEILKNHAKNIVQKVVNVT